MIRRGTRYLEKYKRILLSAKMDFLLPHVNRLYSYYIMYYVCTNSHGVWTNSRKPEGLYRNDNEFDYLKS